MYFFNILRLPLIAILTLLISCNKTVDKNIIHQDIRQEADSFLLTVTNDYKELGEQKMNLQRKIMQRRRLKPDSIAIRKWAEKSSAVNQLFATNTTKTKAVSLMERNNELSSSEIRQLYRLLYLSGQSGKAKSDIRQHELSAQMNLFDDGRIYNLYGRGMSHYNMDSLMNTYFANKYRFDLWKRYRRDHYNLVDKILERKQLLNETAKSNAFNDALEYSAKGMRLEAVEVKKISRDIIQQIQPLYKELHTYINNKISKRYGIAPKSEIPSHWLPLKTNTGWADLIGKEYWKKQRANEQNILTTINTYLMLWGIEGYLQEKTSFKSLSKTVEFPSALFNDFGKNHYNTFLYKKGKVKSFRELNKNIGQCIAEEIQDNDDEPALLQSQEAMLWTDAFGTFLSLTLEDFEGQKALFGDDFNLPDTIALQMSQALDYVVLLQNTMGVCTPFESLLYEENLSSERLDERYRGLMKDVMGIDEPKVQSKSSNISSFAHNDLLYNNPLYAFHKGISIVIAFQIFQKSKVMESKELGQHLMRLLYSGGNAHWRSQLRLHLNEPLTAQPILDYFQPLMKYLKEENKPKPKKPIKRPIRMQSDSLSTSQ